MKTKTSIYSSNRKVMVISLTITSMLFIGLIAGCGLVPGGGNDDLHSTETALAAQVTKIAQQATTDAQNAQATNVARQVTVLTQAANQVPPTPVQPVVPVVATVQPEQPTQPPAPVQPSEAPQTGMDDRMKNAAVLLYESSAGGGDEVRLAKYAFQNLGMANITDVGDAVGALDSKLKTYGPTGSGWDLIFISSESRDTFQGTMFDSVANQLNRGTPVVLTSMWYWFDIFQGHLTPILNQCGVAVSDAWVEKSAAEYVIYPVNDHPIQHVPNEGLAFQPTGLWSGLPAGTELTATGQGDAVVVYGTDPQNKASHGMITVCMKDHLIIQGFQDHIFPADVMVKLFENYIYNALKARFSGS